MCLQEKNLQYQEREAVMVLSYSSLSPEEQANMANLSQEELMGVIASYTDMSNSTYEENLSKLGIL